MVIENCWREEGLIGRTDEQEVRLVLRNPIQVQIAPRPGLVRPCSRVYQDLLLKRVQERMAARVFISCGQSTEEERRAAQEIKGALRRKGFRPYVAIQSQSIQDVNSGIIEELKRADYCLFIDFKRERLDDTDSWRGSLFTNQELAIAYLLGLDRVLFFQQEGVKLEGLLRYMASNATSFNEPKRLPQLISEALSDRGWTPDYTRHLAILRSRWSIGDLTYHHPNGEHRHVRAYYTDVENRRNDVGAPTCTARWTFDLGSQSSRSRDAIGSCTRVLPKISRVSVSRLS